MDLSINHFGLTVTDLDRSTAFYTAFGGEVIVDTAHFEGRHMDRALGVKGVDLMVRMISFKNVVVELLQYSAPPSEPYTSRNCDTGASHIAFQVADLDAIYQDLQSQGIEFYSEPNPIDDGAFRGGFWVYAKDPDGVSVEFLQPGPGFAEALV